MAELRTRRVGGPVRAEQSREGGAGRLYSARGGGKEERRKGEGKIEKKMENRKEKRKRKRERERKRGRERFAPAPIAASTAASRAHALVGRGAVVRDARHKKKRGPRQ